MSVQKEDQLLEIANDSSPKATFDTTTLSVFWIKVMAEYPDIATTSGFSAMADTKTKQRNNLNKARHFEYYYFLLSPDGTVSLQRNKLRVFIDLTKN